MGKNSATTREIARMKYHHRRTKARVLQYQRQYEKHRYFTHKNFSDHGTILMMQVLISLSINFEIKKNLKIGINMYDIKIDLIFTDPQKTYPIVFHIANRFTSAIRDSTVLLSQRDRNRFDDLNRKYNKLSPGQTLKYHYKKITISQT